MPGCWQTPSRSPQSWKQALGYKIFRGLSEREAFHFNAAAANVVPLVLEIFVPESSFGLLVHRLPSCRKRPGMGQVHVFGECLRVLRCEIIIPRKFGSGEMLRARSCSTILPGVLCDSAGAALEGRGGVKRGEVSLVPRFPCHPC